MQQIINILLKVLILEMKQKKNSYFRYFLVDTNVPYPTQVPANYYKVPPQQQPPDTQQWSQHITQPDILSISSQIPSTNNSYNQPLNDQSSSYIQPGFTSTPNPHTNQQVQQPWYPSGSIEQRDRLPSTEVCKNFNQKKNTQSKKRMKIKYREKKERDIFSNPTQSHSNNNNKWNR